MPTYPLFRFVDAPTTTANVRYDFNASFAGNGRATIAVDGFDLGVPVLDGEPDAVGVDYGLRTITLTQRVFGTLANAMAKHSALSRELMRERNWLFVQLAADRDPVWFYTYRPEPESMSFDHATIGNDPGPDLWEIGVSIPAEPFAYGPRTTLSTITVNNDPASGTNPCRAVLPAIVGDAPAPLRISVNPSNTNATDGYRFMFSMIAADAAPSAIVWQVGGTDGWTAGTDTSASTADATMSGGTRRTVSFATNATLIDRLTGAAPAALAAGKYKVLVRVARSDTASTFAMRFGQLVAFSYFYGDTVLMDRGSSTGSGHATWVDLGDFNHPRGHRAPDGQNGFSFAPNIALQAQRLSGAGSLHIDAFMLVPLNIEGDREVRTLFSEFPTIGIGNAGGFGVFDGDEKGFWHYNGFGFPEVADRVELAGEFPRVIPGASHVLTFLQQVNGRKPFFGSDASDLITVSTDLTISYHPRWLYAGDG